MNFQNFEFKILKSSSADLTACSYSSSQNKLRVLMASKKFANPKMTQIRYLSHDHRLAFIL